MLDIYTF